MRWNEITGLLELGNIIGALHFHPTHVSYFSDHRRRICPGLPVVEHQLWLAISRLLWSFTFHALPDEPIALQEYEGTSGRKPLPFRLKLIPLIENLKETLQTREKIVL